MLPSQIIKTTTGLDVNSPRRYLLHNHILIIPDNAYNKRYSMKA
jgi:hypothetical protein